MRKLASTILSCLMAATAQQVSPPVTITGGAGSPGDMDTYRILVGRGQRLIFEVLSPGRWPIGEPSRFS